MAKGLENIKNKNYLVSNDINGDCFAVVLKGEDIVDRIIKSIQEEFDSEKVKISNVEKFNGVSFKVNLDEDTEQFITLTSAFIY